MSEPIMVQCANCGRTYNRAILRVCPRCENSPTYSFSSSQGGEGESDSNLPLRRRDNRDFEQQDTTSKLLEDILKASRKTTHAIRSIARFLMIMVTSSLIGGAILGLGIGTMAWPIIIIGALVTLIGYIVAIADAWSELNQSN